MSSAPSFASRPRRRVSVPPPAPAGARRPASRRCSRPGRSRSWAHRPISESRGPVPRVPVAGRLLGARLSGQPALRGDRRPARLRERRGAARARRPGGVHHPGGRRGPDGDRGRRAARRARARWSARAGSARRVRTGRSSSDGWPTAAAAAGIALLGPNCLGYFDARHGIAATFSTALQLDATRPRVGSPSSARAARSARGSSRSGGLQHAGLGMFVSTGNEACLGVADVAALSRLRP